MNTRQSKYNHHMNCAAYWQARALELSLKATLTEFEQRKLDDYRKYTRQELETARACVTKET